MVNFKELGVDDKIIEELTSQGITKATEIQEKTIPLILQKKNVIAGSKTGSGKTLAFGLGIYQNIKASEGIKAIVLTPTRELAEQIWGVFTGLSKARKLNLTKIYGGVAYEPQEKSMKIADILIGTPGRTLDHIKQGNLDLSKIEFVVIDEADRMFEMGFIEDVEKILKKTPKEKQMLLFSATLSSTIRRLAESQMKEVNEISLENYVDPSKLRQIYYDIHQSLKLSLLVHLLKKEKKGLAMVFANSRDNVDFLEKNLKNQGIKALALHGGLTQAKRNEIMEKFHTKNFSALICTDVAARGLDIDGVSHVYNYDIPKDSRQYVHRVGRTARAGKNGIAINILSERDYDNFAKVQRDNAMMTIKRMQAPYVEKVEMEKIERTPRQHFKRKPNRKPF